MTSAVAALTIEFTTLAWTLALIVDSGPFGSASTVLIGIGLLAMSTVSMVGMIVVGGRWAHRLAFVTLLFGLVVAVARPIDWIWWVGVVISATSFGALLSPTLTTTIRKLPSGSGPPPRAVAPAVILLTTPCLLGFTGNEATSWALLVVGLTALAGTLAYSRVLPGGLLSVRIIWPLLVLVLTPWLGWFGGIVAAILALTVSATSWGRSVKASYHPPVEVGTKFPIPPEMTPSEVLEAAEIDERGRPK